jgi:uncharacterized membrane protein YgcG
VEARQRPEGRRRAADPELNLDAIFGADGAHWNKPQRRGGGGLGALLPLLFIVLFVVAGRGRRGGRLGDVGTGMLLGSVLGGGGGGRRFGGGGSFGGGGGSFSGGGASGGW